MSEAPVDNSRRTWLITSCAMGGVGAAAVAVPFATSFAPSERAKAAGASVEFDVSVLAPGEKAVVEWRGKPVWIMRRTEEQIASLEAVEPELADPNSERTAYPTPEYARNRHRSIKPEFFVGVGICSHLGCSPIDKLTPGAQPSLPDNWPGGFLCPCHGSTFDVAGRVFRNKPAPDNLEVPPHYYASETVLVIGEDQAA
ncbi:MAG: ubiquinol-cytochrome c reductase iron-sulfur subunit [Serpentinimonas sp.]|jgi:ubiquinol-cytochrome c reductase iron-sulfur subunit|nr:ubiquinol-cytochrome c reductase iron-sulfur subunit [Serpentinimonas sp.]